MSEEKINLLEWQCANRDYPDDAKDVEKGYVGELKVLTFKIDNKGVNIVSSYNGHIVFVDRTSPYEVTVGDTWICRLTSRDLRVWYAIPVIKITLSEVLNFNEELRENVLSVLWNRNRKEITEMLESRLRNEIKDKITDDIDKKNSEEKERLNKRIEELEHELHETRFQLDAQGKSSPITADDDYILLGSEDAVKPIVSETEVSEKHEINTETDSPPRIQATATPISQTPKAIPQIKRVTAVPQKYEVERVGEDSLRSPSFTDRRYFAHLSPDYHTLVIRPDDEGRVYCLDNVIRLEGLGRVSPFTAKKFLPAEYSEIYEGMIVRL